MTTAGQIIAYVDRIASRFKPQRIVLFGSYAYGTPNADSDVDLLVIKEYRGREHAAALQIRLAIDATFPLDLLVRRQKEIDWRIANYDFFLKEIMEKGLVLYDADHPRVGAENGNRLRRRLAAAKVA